MIIQILIILDNGILRQPLPTINNTPRTGNYTYPQNNNAARLFLHHNDRNRLRGPRSSALTSNPHVHFEESLPPYRCKYCTQNCVTNAYHWHYDCTFKNQNPTSLTTSTTTGRQITPESWSEQNSSDDVNNSY